MRLRRVVLTALAALVMVFAISPISRVAAQEAPAPPIRSEIPIEFTWDLESIYASDADWEADFQAVRESVPRLASYRGTLGESAGRLLEFLTLQGEVGKKLDQIYVFASMRRDENTADSHYQGLASRVETLASDAGEATAFFSPELLALPEEQVREHMATEPGLQIYSHSLEDLLRQKPHVRSTEVEELLAQSSEVARTAQDAYEVLTNADMKFPTITDETGRQVELSNANYGRYIVSPVRRVRQEAWEALTGTYGQYRNTLASTLAGSIRSSIFFAQVRNYSSSLEAALAPDNLPEGVYHSLIQAVNDNLPLLHRYMALRKRVMGVDELQMWDRYVPLIPEVDYRVPYDEAVKTLLAALEPLGPDYVEAARQGLASRWVDVYETEGKRSGAYSWGSYTTKPFILMNYQGTLDDVYTLAHEMGHAMHSYYTQRNQPYVYSNPSIFTAETASNVHETLLTEYLVRTATDPKMQTYLINKEIDSFQGTFFLQALYAEFELEAHRRAEAGDALTPDLLDQMWTDLGTKYFGPNMKIDKGWAVVWSRIPHFYRNFYVYQYSTGLAGASAVAQQVLAEGQPAAQRYVDFLSSGGSEYPLELLRTAGVDMASPEPVNQALRRFEQLLDRMEASLP